MNDTATQAGVRARDLGVPLDGTPGRHNAITDVAGVGVGYTTLYSAADGICTGVTAILPRNRADIGIPCAADTFSLNGNGEMTGRAWIEGSGQFNTPVLLTNSHSVGICHSTADRWLYRNYPHLSEQWLLPVVAETRDGYLNDINGQHVDVAHAQSALESATSGPIAEGSRRRHRHELLRLQGRFRHRFEDVPDLRAKLHPGCIRTGELWQSG